MTDLCTLFTLHVRVRQLLRFLISERVLALSAYDRLIFSFVGSL